MHMTFSLISVGTFFAWSYRSVFARSYGSSTFNIFKNLQTFIENTTNYLYIKKYKGCFISTHIHQLLFLNRILFQQTIFSVSDKIFFVFVVQKLLSFLQSYLFIMLYRFCYCSQPPKCTQKQISIKFCLYFYDIFYGFKSRIQI